MQWTILVARQVSLEEKLGNTNVEGNNSSKVALRKLAVLLARLAPDAVTPGSLKAGDRHITVRVRVSYYMM